MSQEEPDKAIKEMGIAEFDTVLCTQLIDAITRRVEIEFLYEDDPYFFCHPHVLFVGPDNVVFLEGFRPRGGFRDYDIRRFHNLEVTGRSFEPDLTIVLDNPKYRKVFCSIHNV